MRGDGKKGNRRYFWADRVPLFHSLSNMAAFYLYTFNLIPHSHSPSASSNPDSLSNLNSISAKIDKRRSSCRTSGFTVLSTHSNPRILKSNRRSRYGQVLSPYDTDDNAGDEDGDWFFDVSSMFFFSPSSSFGLFWGFCWWSLVSVWEFEGEFFACFWLVGFFEPVFLLSKSSSSGNLLLLKSREVFLSLQDVFLLILNVKFPFVLVVLTGTSCIVWVLRDLANKFLYF